MSEEKLYAVKNDVGKYWDFEDRDDFWELSFASCPTTDNEKDAKDVVHDYGGHVVTLAEVPKKMVLTKEQAQIIENARKCTSLTGYISQHCTDRLEELLLVSAYVNGYSVQKEKKYNVKVPHTRFYYWKWKDDEPGIDALTSDDKKDERYRFTESEIEHYGLQDCEK